MRQFQFLVGCYSYPYYPAALTLFTKLHQPSSLVFLQTFPTPQQAQQATEEEILAVLKGAGYRRAGEYVARIYQALHEPQLEANEVTVRTKARLVLVLVNQLIELVEQIALYDQHIEQLFLDHPDSALWASLPGAGQRLAPRLLAEVGDDRQHYHKATNLQAVAGTSPVLFESGNYSKARRRQACIKPLRNALYQFAWQSTRHQAWAAEYYRRKRAEGKTHSVALRALSNNWLRIIFAMWQNQQSYQRAVFETAQHSHQRKAA